MKITFLALLSGSIAIGLGATLIGHSLDAPLLTRHAKRIASMPSRIVGYEWLSDHTFVLYDYDVPQPLIRVDTRTGQKAELENFQHRIGKGAGGYNFKISPDGARALWGTMERGNQGVTSAALDGSSLTKREPARGQFRASVSNMVWLQKSRQWVQLLAGERSIYAVIESLDAPGIICAIPIGYPAGTKSGFNLMPVRLLGCTQTGRILATPDGAAAIQGQSLRRKINFFEFAVNGGPPCLGQYTIRLPKGGEHHDGEVALNRDEAVALSPRGDRLAWIVHVMDQEPPWTKWLARWIPALRTSPPERTELRTSRLDGSDMKVLGYMEPERGADTNPYDLRWLPDGTSISFVYEGALWTISAN